MSSETMQQEPMAILYHLRKKMDEVAEALRDHSAILQQAAIARERHTNEIHQLAKDVEKLQVTDDKQAAELSKLRHEIKGWAQKYEAVAMIREVREETSSPIDVRHADRHMDTNPHPVVADEIKARAKLWTILGAFVAASIGWLSGWFSKAQ